MTSKPEIWNAALEGSKARVLKTAELGDAVLVQATAVRMAAAWTLGPAPADPVHHLAVAHEQLQPHLRRLVDHDPAHEVRAVMTNELYTRLTDARPAPLAAPREAKSYTYTPRKVLRRLLDHTLDHLNQIDQWLVWRADGIVPTPTDGWASSVETLPGDRLPLSRADLAAWHWRIDQAARVFHQRAAGLRREMLDWLPPDGGWPLRRVFHHLARCERLYGASLDEALATTQPAARYQEACRQLEAATHGVGPEHDASIAYPGLYGTLRTPEEIVDDVVTMERELLSAPAPR
jgi:hypothetical protein